MLKKIVFNFIKFQAVNSKIQQNQTIGKSRNINELFSYYQENQTQMNLVNMVSYVRRYTDFMIQRNLCTQMQYINHALEALNKTEQMIMSKAYLLFNDQEKDYKRAFIMLISLSVEMINHCPNQREEFINYSKLAIGELMDHNYIGFCNPQELSVLLRCITQVEELNPSIQDEEMYQKIIQTGNYDAANCCKLLHSLSMFKTYDQNTILLLLNTVSKTNELNIKDSISLFLSLRFIYEINPNFFDLIRDILLKQEQSLMLNCNKLTIKQIAAIYNSYANLNLKFSADFEEYLKKQFLISKDISMLGLAHMFQYFNVNKLELDQSVLKKIKIYLIETKLTNYRDTEQYLMFLHDFIPYCNGEFLQINQLILQEAELNDFCIGRLFAIIYRFHQLQFEIEAIQIIALNQLREYKYPINIHALNSIIRARSVYGGKYIKQIVQAIQMQLSKYADVIINNELLNLIKKNEIQKIQHFLQVFVDFLKVLHDCQQIYLIKDNIEYIIKQIEGMENCQQYKDILQGYL